MAVLFFGTALSFLCSCGVGIWLLLHGPRHDTGPSYYFRHDHGRLWSDTDFRTFGLSGVRSFQIENPERKASIRAVFLLCSPCPDCGGFISNDSGSRRV